MRRTVPGIRTFVLIFVFLIFSFLSYSQSIISGNGKIEAGFAFGPMFFLGDLGGNAGVGTRFVKDVNLPLTKLSKNIYAVVYPREWLGVRMLLNHGMIEGFDSIIKRNGGDEEFRADRNLDFRSNIWEGHVALEFYPTVFLEKYDGLTGKLRPYVTGGVGLFHFNPQGIYYDPNENKSWVDLHPLRLEGQGMAEYPDRKPYKLTQVEVPVGAGAKYYLKENFYMGLEVIHRQTFTDYIDDVSTNYIDGSLFEKYLSSAQVPLARQLHNRQNFRPTGPLNRILVDPQRGSPKQNDSFFSTVFRFGWRLNDHNSPEYRASKQLRCPTFY